MPLPPRVARTSAGMHPTTRRYPVAVGETYSLGAIVQLDGSQDVIETTGADPTPMLGLAEEGAEDSVFPGFGLVTVFTTDVVLAMEGDRAPVLDDINVAYGIVLSGGVWIVDTTETINTRVFVVDVDEERNEFLVKVLDAHRQSPE